LLRAVGLLPDLSHEGSSLVPLMTKKNYVVDPEHGLRLAHDDDAHCLTGQHWRMLQAAMDAPDPLIASLRACAPFESALRPQLRRLLHYHCGVRVFKTRQLMIDVQAMSRIAPDSLAHQPLSS